MAEFCAGARIKVGARGEGRKETWVTGSPHSPQTLPVASLAMRRRRSPRSAPAHGPAIRGPRSPRRAEPGAAARCPLAPATTLRDDTALTLAGACSCMLMTPDGARLANCRQSSEDSSGATYWFSATYPFAIRRAGGPTTGRTELRFKRPLLWCQAKFMATAGRDDTSATAEKGDGEHE